MEKHRAIPQGYMTIGELAKKMDVTVRTLQYYDKEGLLTPSAQSDGGRRLYCDEDLVLLHQILSLKTLGFSLEDIKKRLIPLKTPVDVARMLDKQATSIQEEIESLTESLRAIEMLKGEVLQMQSVNFKKYADIIVNLRLKNEFYWLIKCFDDQTMDHIRNRFDIKSGKVFIEKFSSLTNSIYECQQNQIQPDSEPAQVLAKAFWDLVIEFADGDLTLLPKIMEMSKFENVDNEWVQKQAITNEYIGKALDAYFTKLNINPFTEVPK